MPRAVSYTPAWLSKPNPGHELFTGAQPNALGTHKPSLNGFSTSRKGNSKPGPRRTIARRGTEVFIAVGKEIRWADLVYLKEAWEESQQKGKATSKDREQETQYDDDHAQGYRTIKIPVAEDIRQLIISSYANYMAILTTHTVHIAVLPDSSHLTAPDTGPMRLKTYTLGPTTHVTSQPSIASALWHPLGVNGSCLVTVTEDAIVRVWEISTADRWSFDRPTLAIDLKKLADGISVDQDFTASTSGRNTGFTPDSVEMEVASACFGGTGSGGWSPMTLWVAMREGDVYALCPLLPDKFSPPPTLIPSLSISIVATVAAIEDDRNVPDSDKRLAQQQLAWMSDLDVQEPAHIEAPPGYQEAEVFTRPAKPGKVPRLQGPFDFELAPEESEDELDSLLTDIFVIGPRMDSEQLMFGEENDIELDEVEEGGLSLGVVCLLTSSGRLSICLDIDGVQAQWLPTSRPKNSRLVDEADPQTLLTFQVLDTSRHEEVWEGNWPMFSDDVHSRYSFYITDASSVTFISLAPWVDRLESEFRDGAAGTDFRIDLLAKGHGSIRERIYTEKSDDHSSPLAASTLIRDPDLGYFLLTATPYGPVAVTFETPEIDNFEPVGHRSRSPTYDAEPDRPLILCEPRPVYRPAHALEENSALPSFLEKLRHSKYKRLLKEEIRLSPATLTIMTDAHKVLSEETHRLGTAAAELFRKCERLQIELRSHVKKLNEVASRVEAVTGNDRDGGPTISTDESVEKRIQEARKRQRELTDRVEKIKRKASKGSNRELTDREKEWFQEVTSLQEKILGKGDGAGISHGRTKEPWARYEEASHLKEDLLEQAREISVTGESPTPPSSIKVPSEVRKAKMAQIMALLNRESALVEGAKIRLEKLRLS